MKIKFLQEILAKEKRISQDGEGNYKTTIQEMQVGQEMIKLEMRLVKKQSLLDEEPSLLLKIDDKEEI